MNESDLQLNFKRSSADNQSQSTLNTRSFTTSCCPGSLLPDVFIDFAQLYDLKYLDRGAYAEVYTAVYCGMKVVVKFCRKHVDSEYSELIIGREINILKSLNNSNIVRFIGSGVINLRNGTRQPFLVLEYLEENLNSRISDEYYSMCMHMTPNSANTNSYLLRILRYALMLAKSLAYLHEEWSKTHCIIHRDLKPDNIMFKDGELKLIDFGLSTIIRKREMLHETFEMTGDIGTPRYMAPEIRQTSRVEYNELVDVYSFGLILWMMLTNEKPYNGMTVPQFHSQVVEQHFKPALQDWWPAALCSLLENCWCSEMTFRPHFSDIMNDIELLISELDN